MKYFNKFPDILYNFEVNGEIKYYLVRDIALNVRIRKALVNNITTWDEYDIEDGETPEIISNNLYGVPYYHWVIMILNLRFDYIRDFPMSNAQLDEYVKEKYGEEEIYSQHILNGNPHYVDPKGNVVTKLSEGRYNLLHPDGVSYEEYSRYFTPVTNLDYEIAVNEKKRRIKVLNRVYLEQVVKDIERLINAG